jgi:hypothetical protein
MTKEVAMPHDDLLWFPADGAWHATDDETIPSGLLVDTRCGRQLVAATRADGMLWDDCPACRAMG